MARLAVPGFARNVGKLPGEDGDRRSTHARERPVRRREGEEDAGLPEPPADLVHALHLPEDFVAPLVAVAVDLDPLLDPDHAGE